MLLITQIIAGLLFISYLGVAIYIVYDGIKDIIQYMKDNQSK